MSDLSQPLVIAGEILRESKRPMHVTEIARIAAEKGLIINHSLEIFTKKLNAALIANLNTSRPQFAKVPNKNGTLKKGVYRLRRLANTVELSPNLEPMQSEDTGFIGKAGEYAVMSELLFRNFNVSMMTVDKGIDLVATNDAGKYFHIQVKTSTQKNGLFAFSVKRKNFELHNAGQTFYVFAMRNVQKTEYAIIPNHMFSNYIARGVISGNETLNIRITYEKELKKYKLNNQTDISVHVNKFGQIN